MFNLHGRNVKNEVTTCFKVPGTSVEPRREVVKLSLRGSSVPIYITPGFSCLKPLF